MYRRVVDDVIFYMTVLWSIVCIPNSAAQNWFMLRFIHTVWVFCMVLRCGAVLFWLHLCRPLSTVHSGDVTVHSGYQSAL